MSRYEQPPMLGAPVRVIEWWEWPWFALLFTLLCVLAVLELAWDTAALAWRK